MADAAEKEAADSDPMQAVLRLLRAAFVQLCSIGEAVVSLGKGAQRDSAAAAWVEQIGGNAGRECNAPRHHLDVLRIGGIIPHANVVHQPSDDGGVSGDSLPGRNPLDVVVQQSDEFAVIRGHHRKTCNGLPKLGRISGELLHFQLQQCKTAAFDLFQ